MARRDGLSQRVMDLRPGIFQVTVELALAAEHPTVCERASGPTSFDPFGARVAALLWDHPSMLITIVAQNEPQIVAPFQDKNPLRLRQG